LPGNALGQAASAGIAVSTWNTNSVLARAKVVVAYQAVVCRAVNARWAGDFKHATWNQ